MGRGSPASAGCVSPVRPDGQRSRLPRRPEGEARPAPWSGSGPLTLFTVSDVNVTLGFGLTLRPEPPLSLTASCSPRTLSRSSGDETVPAVEYVCVAGAGAIVLVLVRVRAGYCFWCASKCAACVRVVSLCAATGRARSDRRARARASPFRRHVTEIRKLGRGLGARGLRCVASCGGGG